MSIDTDSIMEASLFANRYKIEKLLGAGGMGRVYLAHDTILDNMPVALKVISKELCADDKHVKRFLREVQLTRKITHVNVVRTFDVGTTVDGLVYFTMEYAEGVTLADKIKEGVIEIEHIPIIIKEIAKGLQAIHEQGVVHRDLKPGNVILTSNGDIQIMDFGVAKLEVSNLTGHNEIVGSSRYMAPEAWTGGEIMPATDLYSLGIIAYEMITGLTPFEGETQAEIMYKHLDQEPPKLSIVASDIPLWLENLISILLKKKAQDRPSTSKEVIDLIQNNTNSTYEQNYDELTREYVMQASQAIFDVELSAEPEIKSILGRIDTINPEPTIIAPTLSKINQSSFFAKNTLLIIVLSTTLISIFLSKFFEVYALLPLKYFFDFILILNLISVPGLIAIQILRNKQTNQTSAYFSYLSAMISFSIILSIYYIVLRSIKLFQVYQTISLEKLGADFTNIIGKSIQNLLEVTSLMPIGTIYTSNYLVEQSNIASQYSLLLLFYAIGCIIIISILCLEQSANHIKVILMTSIVLLVLLSIEYLALSYFDFTIKNNYFEIALFGLTQKISYTSLGVAIFNWGVLFASLKLWSKWFYSKLA